MDTRQLVLISDEPSRDWRLDDHTRQVGRAGIAAARQALQTANSHLLHPKASVTSGIASGHRNRDDHDGHDGQSHAA